MIEFYKKQIKKREVIALDILRDINLINDIYPIFYLKDDKLFVEKCKQENSFTIDYFIQTVDICVRKIYKYQYNFFSPGIYSFIPSSGYYFSPKNYFCNLKNETLFFLEKYSIKKEYNELFKDISYHLDKFEEKNDIQVFSLLHGDLHPGNIVMKNNEVLLIDWEYLSFGLPEVELSYFFLLFLINVNYDNTQSKKLIHIIKRRSKKWKINYDMMEKIFIPLIGICFLVCLENNFIINEMFEEKKLYQFIQKEMKNPIQ